jgi:hypothetical protein
VTAPRSHDERRPGMQGSGVDTLPSQSPEKIKSPERWFRAGALVAKSTEGRVVKA